jgi:3-methyladenine DNA glycosylase AlkD
MTRGGTRRSGTSVANAAAAARRDLERLARPAGNFDASRYFRGSDELAFHNVGTAAMRALARAIYDAHRGDWRIGDALAFADALIVDRYLETKSVGIEVVARYRREFTPALLARWKRWLAGNHAANWATTDHICGTLVGPTLVRHPAAARTMRDWSRHSNMWVRRASIVGLIPLARQGEAQDLVYDIARRLHADDEDLIQKAVGWALREAGKSDAARLERYLRAHGPKIPRTTLRYAIERFPPAKRRTLLKVTKPVLAPTKKHLSRKD